jgi:hypothetical protein
MFGIKDHVLENLRKTYPPGTRVELVYMSDKYSPPVGTKGEVVVVDSVGTIHVEWDNGGTLGVVYGEDSVKKI